MAQRSSKYMTPCCDYKEYYTSSIILHNRSRRAKSKLKSTVKSFTFSQVQDYVMRVPSLLSINSDCQEQFQSNESEIYSIIFYVFDMFSRCTTDTTNVKKSNHLKLHQKSENKCHEKYKKKFESYYNDRNSYISNKFNKLSLTSDPDTSSCTKCPVHSKKCKQKVSLDINKLEETYWATWKPKSVDNKCCNEQPNINDSQQDGKYRAKSGNLNSNPSVSNINIGNYVQCPTCLKYKETDIQPGSTHCMNNDSEDARSCASESTNQKRSTSQTEEEYYSSDEYNSTSEESKFSIGEENITQDYTCDANYSNDKSIVLATDSSNSSSVSKTGSVQRQCSCSQDKNTNYYPTSQSVCSKTTDDISKSAKYYQSTSSYSKRCSSYLNSIYKETSETIGSEQHSRCTPRLRTCVEPDLLKNRVKKISNKHTSKLRSSSEKQTKTSSNDNEIILNDKNYNEENTMNTSASDEIDAILSDVQNGTYGTEAYDKSTRKNNMTRQPHYNDLHPIHQQLTNQHSSDITSTPLKNCEEKVAGQHIIHSNSIDIPNNQQMLLNEHPNTTYVIDEPQISKQINSIDKYAKTTGPSFHSNRNAVSTKSKLVSLTKPQNNDELQDSFITIKTHISNDMIATIESGENSLSQSLVQSNQPPSSQSPEQPHSQLTEQQSHGKSPEKSCSQSPEQLRSQIHEQQLHEKSNEQSRSQSPEQSHLQNRDQQSHEKSHEQSRSQSPSNRKPEIKQDNTPQSKVSDVMYQQYLVSNMQNEDTADRMIVESSRELNTLNLVSRQGTKPAVTRILKGHSYPLKSSNKFGKKSPVYVRPSPAKGYNYKK